MLDAVVAHYPTAGERAEAISRIRHEIQRRIRSATRTSSWEKTCPTCNTSKEHSHFNRDATRPDGLDWRCRLCVASRSTTLTVGATADAPAPRL